MSPPEASQGAMDLRNALLGKEGSFGESCAASKVIHWTQDVSGLPLRGVEDVFKMDWDP